MNKALTIALAFSTTIFALLCITIISAYVIVGLESDRERFVNACTEHRDMETVITRERKGEPTLKPREYRPINRQHCVEDYNTLVGRYYPDPRMGSTESF